MADAAGALSLVAMMVLVRAFWPTGHSPGQWAVAGVVTCATSLLAWRHPAGPRRPTTWLKLIALSLLLAAMFWAANQALDLIKPPGSRRHDAAATVAGFELSSLLCPGLTIVAIAGLARSLVRQAG